jgi:hypothetical protein
MAQFGTYEGHRILSNAMDKTVDRVQRSYESKRKFALEEKQFAENQKRNNIVNEVANMEVAAKKKSLLQDSLRQSEYDRLYKANQFNPDTKFWNEGVYDKDATSEYYGAMKGTSIGDFNKELSFEDRQRMSDNITRITSNEAHANFLDRSKSAGISGDELKEIMGSNDEFKRFMLSNQGKNFTGADDGSLYSQASLDPDISGLNKQVNNSGGQVTAAEVYPGTQMTQATRSEKKLLDNAMKNIEFAGKIDAENSGMFSDDLDEINIDQNIATGKWTLTEKDGINDSDYEIEFDEDKGPYIVSRYGSEKAGTKLYLTDPDFGQRIVDELE